MPKGNIGQQIMSSGSTLSVEMFSYASRGENHIAFPIAALLMIIVLIINITVKVITGKLNKERAKEKASVPVPVHGTAIPEFFRPAPVSIQVQPRLTTGEVTI